MNNYSSFAISIMLILLLAASEPCSTQPATILQQPTTTTTTTTTTASDSSLYIEDPSESESTSESSEEDDNDLCFKCYNQITEVQKMIAIHENLKEKEKKLIRQKASSKAPISKPKPNSQKNTRNQTNTSASTTTVRSSASLDESLSDYVGDNNRPIVVSRLRVARSTGETFGFLPSLDTMRRLPKNNVDPDLKKLKLKQEQHFNKTCKVVYEVKQCLKDLTRSCVGNLHFHSMEVYLQQWLLILECPKNGAKVFTRMPKTLTIYQEKPREPYARPMTTQEETSRKLNIILNRNTSPFVVLPTLTKTASNRFESIKPSNQQHQPQQYLVGQPKGVIVSKEFSFNGFHGQITGQLLLLIPCFALAVIILITLSLRYFKTSSKTQI